MSAIRQSFDRAAERYDAYAHQQRAVLEQLLTLVQEQGNYHFVLDGGCGTGYLSTCLKQKNLNWQVMPLDLADGMCRRVAADGYPAIQGRLESLPFAFDSFDLVFSSLAVQWVSQPLSFLQEVQRVLKPGGTLAFSTYTAGTLAELKAAFAAVDAYDHTLEFLPRSFWLRMIQDSGLTLMTMQSQSDHEYFESVRHLCDHLRGLGASQKTGQARRSMMTPRQFHIMEHAYPATGNGIQARWELGYFIVRKGE